MKSFKYREQTINCLLLIYFLHCYCSTLASPERSVLNYFAPFISVLTSLIVGEKSEDFGSVDLTGMMTYVHPVALPMTGVIKHLSLFAKSHGDVVIGHYKKVTSPCGFQPVKLLKLTNLQIGVKTVNTSFILTGPSKFCGHVHIWLNGQI